MTQDTQAVQEELRRLNTAYKGPRGRPEAAQKTRCKRCCLTRCRYKEGCLAEVKQCKFCQETGHFARSSSCPKRKLTTKKLKTKAESETKSIGRILNKVRVGKVQDNRVQDIRVILKAAA